ncbi:MAG: phosphatase PAP2 family protein [Lachnospiraceae bacterium]|nr:phosphatase PAP2 family protein [Lachnospiraceae bacterium]
MKDKIKFIIKKYGHVWTASYIFLYLPWFLWLERTVTPQSDYFNIHIWIDDIIPFNEVFVIPYLLWFLYVPVSMAYIALRSKKEFYKASIYLFVGMSICLFICTIWPNGQDLRIENLDVNKNIFTAIVGMIYHSDTNTNVFPSIHSFNSFAIFMMLFKSEYISGKFRKPVLISTGILTALIIASTVILKQHSIVDAIGGVGLGIIMYILVYVINWKKLFKKSKKETVEVNE